MTAYLSPGDSNSSCSKFCGDDFRITLSGVILEQLNLELLDNFCGLSAVYSSNYLAKINIFLKNKTFQIFNFLNS